MGTDTLGGYPTGRMRRDEERNWGVENARENAAYAQRCSRLILGIEPVDRFESHFVKTVADAVRFVEAMGLPNVKVHLDAFHMIRESERSRVLKFCRA